VLVTTKSLLVREKKVQHPKHTTNTIELKRTTEVKDAKYLIFNYLINPNDLQLPLGFFYRGQVFIIYENMFKL